MITRNVGLIRLDRWELNLDEQILFKSNDAIVKEYIESGFLPIHETKEIEIFKGNFIEKYFYYGYSLDEIALWDNLDLDMISQSVIQIFWHAKWIFCNLHEWINISIRLGTSLPLLLYGKDYLYKSNRPKTDMSIFRQIKSRRYIPRTLKDEGQYIRTLMGQYKCLPVTRYSSGMSKGLFYKEDNLNDKYCGTFYYYEPESTIYLTFETYRIYRNKFEAYLDLNDIIEKKEDHIPFNDKYDGILADIIEEKQYQYYMNPNKFPSNLMMYPEEIDQSLIEWPKVKRYAGHLLGLYALEDRFDQNICLKAKEKGIDIILLTCMVGSHQIVSEILDTRSRLQSFSSLAYPI